MMFDDKQQDVSYHLNSSNWAKIKNIEKSLEFVIQLYGGEKTKW